jgi:hypothetical protein
MKSPLELTPAERAAMIAEGERLLAEARASLTARVLSRVDLKKPAA